MAYNVPRYEELSVKHIFNKVKDDEDVMRYLDFYKDDKDLPEREYFFSIVGSLEP